MESDEELELLLAFQNGDCVPATPPASPSPATSQQNISGFTNHSSAAKCAPVANKIAANMTVREALEEVFGHDSDEDCDLVPKKPITMAAFKDVVSVSLRNVEHNPSKLSARQPLSPATNGIDTETNSGLRIRNRLVSSASLSNRLSDIRFIRLQAIRTAMIGENISGCWATVGVLSEKGMPKVSSNGKNFAIWKLATLDTNTVSLFLFGDAYTRHWKEPAGSIAAVFNAKVWRDNKRNELSLSIFASDQLMMLGTSVDYCICKGMRKDGTPCSVVVNRRHGQYCQYHITAARRKYKSKRGELSGGNLATGFSDPYKIRGSQGTRDHSEAIINSKPDKPVKQMTSGDLKKILSNADKVTTKYQSQGIRFLASLTNASIETVKPKSSSKRHNKEQCGPDQKRPGLNKKVQFSGSQPTGKENSQNKKDEHGLMELDLDGPDDAMVQAMNLFQRHGTLQ